MRFPLLICCVVVFVLLLLCLKRGLSGGLGKWMDGGIGPKDDNKDR